MLLAGVFLPDLQENTSNGVWQIVADIAEVHKYVAR